MTKSKRDLFEFVETSKNGILWIFALRNHWIASRHVIFRVRKPSVFNKTDWYLSPEKTGNMWLANMTIVEPGPPVITLRTYFHSKNFVKLNSEVFILISYVIFWLIIFFFTFNASQISFCQAKTLYTKESVRRWQQNVFKSISSL